MSHEGGNQNSLPVRVTGQEGVPTASTVSRSSPMPVPTPTRTDATPPAAITLAAAPLPAPSLTTTVVPAPEADPVQHTESKLKRSFLGFPGMH